MVLKTAAFSTVGELVTFVNANVIAQSDIVTINHLGGQWYVFYYANP